MGGCGVLGVMARCSLCALLISCAFESDQSINCNDSGYCVRRIVPIYCRFKSAWGRGVLCFYFLFLFFYWSSGGCGFEARCFALVGWKKDESEVPVCAKPVEFGKHVVSALCKVKTP